MKVIKFASSQAPAIPFGTAVRERVNAYFRERGISPKGNHILVAQTLIHLAFYFIPFVLILTVPMGVWPAMGLMVVMGIGTAGVGMGVMHDAAHGSYSDKNWINNMMARTMYILGSNLLNWKIQHNVLHHTYTNIAEYDEDINSKGPIRLSEHAPLKPIHRYQHIHAFFFYGLLTLSKLVKDFTQLAEYNRNGLTRQMHKKPGIEYTKMLLAKLFYLSIFIGLPILLTPFTWWQVLIGFFIMHWTAGCILSTIFQLAHVVEGADQPLPDDNGIVDNDWAVHELLTTANFARKNVILNWYVGGLNFQIEHHLFPNISHVHYPDISPIVEQVATEYGLHYNVKPTFRDALKSHIRRLKALGQPAAVQAA